MSKISLKKFISHFSDNIRTDKKFCFILGSGASKSSGIPTGDELVKIWIKELREIDEENLNKWLTDNKINEENFAENYSKIFDKRFELSKKDGYAFLEKQMEGKEPSCGYSALAQILAQGNHNIVITTNFDSLTEDALFIYTQKKPLVIGHSTLANYIKPNPTRPIIIKIHHDLFLSPKNSEQDTCKLDVNVSKNLSSIFKYYTPLVIGYGGNDGSLMSFLENIEIIEGGLFWFYHEPSGIPNKRITNLIEKFGGFLIPIKGFDDLMIQLANKLKLGSLDEKILEIANKRVQNYRDQIKKLTEEKTIDEDTKVAMSDIIARGGKNWWYYEMEASKETDPDKKNTIYLEGIKQFPSSFELMNNYAIFLSDARKDYDKAEEYYKKAIELNPNHASTIGNYAIFLSDERKDYDKAEEYYKKAIELDPNYAYNIGNYSKFLIQKGEFNQAKEKISLSFELNKTDFDDILELELWFYCYAIFYDCFPESETKMNELLKNGAKSIGWNLKDILEIAKSNGHPNYNKLCEYEKRITEPDKQ